MPGSATAALLEQVGEKRGLFGQELRRLKDYFAAVRKQEEALVERERHLGNWAVELNDREQGLDGREEGLEAKRDKQREMTRRLWRVQKYLGARRRSLKLDKSTVSRLYTEFRVDIPDLRELLFETGPDGKPKRGSDGSLIRTAWPEGYQDPQNYMVIVPEVRRGEPVEGLQGRIRVPTVLAQTLEAVWGAEGSAVKPVTSLRVAFSGSYGRETFVSYLPEAKVLRDGSVDVPPPYVEEAKRLLAEVRMEFSGVTRKMLRRGSPMQRRIAEGAELVYGGPLYLPELKRYRVSGPAYTLQAAGLLPSSETHARLR